MFVDSVSDVVPDAFWSAAKFWRRVSLLRGAFDSFVHDCLESKDDFARSWPPDRDPYYDPPTHLLIGVASVYLEACNFVMATSEAPLIVSFKGEVVGELEVEVHPLLESQRRALDQGLPVFQTQELSLASFIGEPLHLGFKVKHAHGLPKQLCSSCFVSFRFFVEPKPLRTGCCGAPTTAPKWDQTLGVTVLVSGEFVHYVKTEALELEVWAAAESKLTGEKADPPPVYGEKIEVERGALGEEAPEDDGAASEGSGSEGDDDADALKAELAATKALLEASEREVRVGVDLLLALVKSFDPNGADRIARGQGARLPAAVRVAKDHLAKVQASCAKLAAELEAKTREAAEDKGGKPEAVGSASGALPPGGSSACAVS